MAGIILIISNALLTAERGGGTYKGYKVQKHMIIDQEYQPRKS